MKKKFERFKVSDEEYGQAMAAKRYAARMAKSEKFRMKVRTRVLVSRIRAKILSLMKVISSPRERYPNEFRKQRIKIFKERGKVCERCNGIYGIMLHHKDRNTYNNTDNNLEVLCFYCHKKEHSWLRIPSWMGV